MSEQGHSDQESGEGPVDPGTPTTSSQTAQPAPEQQGEQQEGKPLSPDQSDPNREGGGYEKVAQPGSQEEDEDN
jgi:hypothetical protein